MSLVDVIAIVCVIGVLALLTYLTRSKDHKGGCAGCHNDCATCGIGQSFYEAYKQDQTTEKKTKQNEE